MKNHRLRRKIPALIIGILVFIAVMCITFSDVYGLTRFEFTSPGNGSDDNNSTTTEVSIPPCQKGLVISHGDYYDPDLPASTDPAAVPEPTTLALLALGCGLFLAGKRRMIR